MDSVNNTNADAKEAETSTEPKHRESKNQGRGVKSSRFNNYTDNGRQQIVSRSSETPEDLETDMNDVQIGKTSSSPGKGKFSFFIFFSCNLLRSKRKGKTGNGARQVNSRIRKRKRFLQSILISEKHTLKCLKQVSS